MKETTLTVHAGEHPRENCPLRFDFDALGFPEGPVVVKDGNGGVVPSQLLGGEKPALCFIVDKLDKAEERTFTVSPGEAPAAPGVRLSKVGDAKIDVEIGGKYFTSYHYAAKWARPFLMPVVGPHGGWITRSYADDEIEKNEDYTHHKSLWVAWGDVNGSDNWSEEKGHGRQVHQGFEALESGPVFGRIAALNHWVTSDGQRVLDERRSLIFYNIPGTGRLLDLSVTFIATEGPVRFGDTKEGGIASIRVAPCMKADGGDGVLVNSYGGTQMDETWGKRAHWCDYFGPLDGKTVGAAIFDTPGNFRYPTYWHARDYGLMTANPFGLSHFTEDPSCDGSHTIEKGAIFPFRYRFYVHAGDTKQADVAGKFLDYVAPPTVAIK